MEFLSSCQSKIYSGAIINITAFAQDALKFILSTKDKDLDRRPNQIVIKKIERINLGVEHIAKNII